MSQQNVQQLVEQTSEFHNTEIRWIILLSKKGPPLFDHFFGPVVWNTMTKVIVLNQTV